jgi:hypothetical protein
LRARPLAELRAAASPKLALTVGQHNDEEDGTVDSCCHKREHQSGYRFGRIRSLDMDRNLCRHRYLRGIPRSQTFVVQVQARPARRVLGTRTIPPTNERSLFTFGTIVTIHRFGLLDRTSWTDRTMPKNLEPFKLISAGCPRYWALRQRRASTGLVVSTVCTMTSSGQARTRYQSNLD